MLWYRRDQSFLWLEIFRSKADTSISSSGGRGGGSSSSSSDKKGNKKIKKSSSDDSSSISDNAPYVSYINTTTSNTTHTTHTSSSPLSSTNQTIDLYKHDLYKPYEQVCNEILYWINTPREVYINTISHQIHAADILREMRKITIPKWGKIYERYMQEGDTNVIPESLLIKFNAVEPVQREYILRGIAERHEGEFPTAAFDLLALLSSTATPATTPIPTNTPTPTTAPASTPAPATSDSTTYTPHTPHTPYTPPYTIPYTALDPFIRASESPTYTKQLIQYTQRINRVRLNTVLHTADTCAKDLMQGLSNEVKSEYLDTSSIKRMLED